MWHIRDSNAIEVGYNISEGGCGGDNFTNHPDKEVIREKIRKSDRERQSASYPPR